VKLRFPMCGVEAGIAGNHIRLAAEALLVHPDRGNQQKSIVDVLLLPSASRLLDLNLAQRGEGAEAPGGCEGQMKGDSQVRWQICQAGVRGRKQKYPRSARGDG
jgi:hypothetical protein